MMNAIFLDAIRKLKTGDVNCDRVFETMEMILEYSKRAREEGLLALEEEIINLTGRNAEEFDYQELEYCHDKLSGVNRIFAVLILLVTSGTEPELIKKIGIAKYWAVDLLGSEALAAYMAIVGALHIQAGTSKGVLEQTLMAVLPEKMENEYISRKKSVISQNKNSVAQIPEEFFREKESTGSCSLIITGFGKYVEMMPDVSLQCVLREIDLSSLGYALKVLSGAARRKILKNVSKRLSEVLYRNVEHGGPIRLTDAEEVIYHIFGICEKLESNGEIIPGEDGCNNFAVKEALYDYEHKTILMNKERELQIQKLKREIADLEQQMVKI